MKKILINIFLFFIVLKLLIDHTIIHQDILTATNLFITKVFPSLFPFFIISDLLINYNMITYINKIFTPISKYIFRLNKNTAYILFMSMFSGFPSSSKYTSELYEQGLISEIDANKVILFSHFSNPLFILSMVPNRPFLVLVCHYMGNFIIALLLRNYHPILESPSIQATESKPFVMALTNSIKKTMDTIFLILGITIVFFCLSSLFYQIPILKYFLELSQGIYYINMLQIPNKISLMLLTALLSFGGFSIHMQVYSILSKIKVRYIPYLIARVGHAIISSLLILILY